jgi:hypothetical protein
MIESTSQGREDRGILGSLETNRSFVTRVVGGEEKFEFTTQ